MDPRATATADAPAAGASSATEVLRVFLGLGLTSFGGGHAVLPFWTELRGRPGVRALIRGANAAVVGILAAALYTPVFTSAITGPAPLCLAAVCFVLLMAWRAPSWVVVLLGAGGGMLLGGAGI
ncbi:chromate transporter [Brachybacterium hainanense]|uniref:Chromate transporter n=1 Tax=Brachybacterium hainanense TaxID=1541174 RepID=A0ABV6R7A0_9MICO